MPGRNADSKKPNPPSNPPPLSPSTSLRRPIRYFSHRHLRPRLRLRSLSASPPRGSYAYAPQPSHRPLRTHAASCVLGAPLPSSHQPPPESRLARPELHALQPDDDDGHDRLVLRVLRGEWVWECAGDVGGVSVGVDASCVGASALSSAASPPPPASVPEWLLSVREPLLEPFLWVKVSLSRFVQRCLESTPISAVSTSPAYARCVVGVPRVLRGVRTSLSVRTLPCIAKRVPVRRVEERMHVPLERGAIRLGGGPRVCVSLPLPSHYPRAVHSVLERLPPPRARFRLPPRPSEAQPNHPQVQAHPTQRMLSRTHRVHPSSEPHVAAPSRASPAKNLLVRPAPPTPALSEFAADGALARGGQAHVHDDGNARHRARADTDAPAAARAAAESARRRAGCRAHDLHSPSNSNNVAVSATPPPPPTILASCIDVLGTLLTAFVAARRPATAAPGARCTIAWVACLRTRSWAVGGGARNNLASGKDRYDASAPPTPLDDHALMLSEMACHFHCRRAWTSNWGRA
ncbi:hypothetical protein C8J57DRAFT_1712148 [Mycena rebaudengoi]|nr:hypothetical protein C8J57DRAFT_1712148 [Mycena rebaudengoi]